MYTCPCHWAINLNGVFSLINISGTFLRDFLKIEILSWLLWSRLFFSLFELWCVSIPVQWPLPLPCLLRLHLRCGVLMLQLYQPIATQHKVITSRLQCFSLLRMPRDGEAGADPRMAIAPWWMAPSAVAARAGQLRWNKIQLQMLMRLSPWNELYSAKRPTRTKIVRRIISCDWARNLQFTSERERLVLVKVNFILLFITMLCFILQDID